MEHAHDVLIVGGGPAGLSAGLFLRLLEPQLDIMVLERLDGGRRERYHSICGEGISSRAFHELDPIAPVVRDRISRAVLEWPGGSRTVQKVDGYILDRPAFLDGITSLYREEGGELRRGSVTSVHAEKGGYRACLHDGSEVSSRYIIGADGAFSTVRRDLFSSRPMRMLSVDRYMVDGEAEDETLRFIMGERYHGGYRWEFPCGGKVNIGFPTGTDEHPGGERASRFLPFGGVGETVNGNALLVGDAAAQANPVSFGGIRTALLAGKRAAQAVASGRPYRYGRWWRRSRLSSPRYMQAHETMRRWSDEEMQAAARPFQGGARVIPFIGRAIASPQDAHMYVAYAFAFRESW